MLIKEYRIPLPLTSEEYKIAQLYMIAKKSRQESHGTGSGIEILVNDPYENGPGPNGMGQYTRKVYHVGSHLPAWVKSLIPKSALSVEEEAWNAYPYTKTRFTCPFVEKFNIEVETYYFDDGGHQENVFHLNSSELKQREVDLIDIVKDQLYGADYIEDEDPTRYMSQKTGRGPLGEEWIKEYWEECKGQKTPLPNGKAIMCAYKLCKVEFRYWGMQTKIEKFIHDSALRKTMLRAHRQAWAWMDEWWGLTIEDIRSIEKETQDLLARKYAVGNENETELENEVEEEEEQKREKEQKMEGHVIDKFTCESSYADTANHLSNQAVINDRINPQRDKYMDDQDENVQKEWGPNSELMLNEGLKKRNSWSRSASRNTLSSHSQASWRMESIRRDSVSSESEDEFFDCQASVVPIIKEDVYESNSALHKWSSLDLLPQEYDGDGNAILKEGVPNNDSIFSPEYVSRVTSDKCKYNLLGRSADTSVPPSPSVSPSHQASPCDTTVLLLVVHGGSVLDSTGEATNKKSDLTTFRGAFESVIRQHYPHLIGRVAIKLISAPAVCAASLGVISSLAPHGFESPLNGNEGTGEDQVPVGALPILGTLSKEYEEGITKTVLALNGAFHEFINSEEGQGFCGQVCIIGDSVGGILCYDALCRGLDPHRGELPSPGQYYRHRTSTSSSAGSFYPYLFRDYHSYYPTLSFSHPRPYHPPPPPPSPTITVSHHHEARRESKAGFSRCVAMGGYCSASSSPSGSLLKFPHSCPVTPEFPLTPPHVPLRKISDPLVSCRGVYPSTQQRKTSAPSAFSGSSSSSGRATPVSHNLHSSITTVITITTTTITNTTTNTFAPALRSDWAFSGDEADVYSKMYRKSHSSCENQPPASTTTNAPLQETPQPVLRSISDSDYQYSKHLTAPFARRRSSSSSDIGGMKRLDFEINDLFLFGCPLGIVLVYRKMTSTEDKTCNIARPACHQVYNLFHPTDPLAVRLEPLLSARFSLLPPVTIPRYTKYPLGDGQPTHLLECIQSHGNVFAATVNSSANFGSPSTGNQRRLSDASIVSTFSGTGDAVPLSTINAVSERWWGVKRLDYALYCPEGLSNFPSNVLPHLFHASYWESYDVIAFIIRQLMRLSHSVATYDDKESCVFLNTQPREKWQKKRTSVKIKNIAANHRGNDIIAVEGAPQHIHARFMYGPLDMVALSGERVDIHVRRDPPSGDWQYLTTTITDKSGRLSLNIPQEKRLGLGIYPIKMIVRGDHTTCSLHVAVLPPKTECVVFSIDGSFTASVSVTGKDPKVRAGAVDVVRHWQELGYLILYITGRPDMQQQKVVAWLAQHNFPHGLVSFADGLSTDPLGHKADYLRSIIQDCEVVIEAAYGSAKDISVYSSLGLKPEQIYIVGKANKKQSSSAQVLADGYAAHLAHLSSLGSTRPARAHPNMSIPKGFFGLPGQTNALRRRSVDKGRSAVVRSHSFLMEQLWSQIKLSRVVFRFKNNLK
ncbi:UNVERIFIED_CONTAM: hypothetical protein RMT77_013735 [Armadillidium vulgare]